MDNDEFNWLEFYNRFFYNHEEFRFYYKDKILDISFSKEGEVLISFGNEEKGYIWKDYSSPQEFLEDKLFDQKTLEGVWNDYIE